MIASDKANLFIQSVLLVAKFLLYVAGSVLSSYLYTHIDTRRGRDDLMSSGVGCHRRYIKCVAYSVFHTLCEALVGLQWNPWSVSVANVIGGSKSYLVGSKPVFAHFLRNFNHAR